jgi:hypothetical protein
MSDQPGDPLVDDIMSHLAGIRPCIEAFVHAAFREHAATIAALEADASQLYALKTGLLDRVKQLEVRNAELDMAIKCANLEQEQLLEQLANTKERLKHYE